jgi:hypothetical protein
MYRIIIALDIEASSTEEAYAKAYETMKQVDTESFQWESTDEWFDEDGELIPPDAVQDIRMKVFGEKRAKGDSND